MPKKNIALHYVKLRIPKIYCIGWEVPSFRFYLTTEQKKITRKQNLFSCLFLLPLQRIHTGMYHKPFGGIVTIED